MKSPIQPAMPLKAYEDLDFLNRSELRAVRLQTELLKPQILLDEAKVKSTVVVFGSARTKPLCEVAPILEEAERRALESPNDRVVQKALRKAQMAERHSRYYAMARELAARISQHGQATSALDFVVVTGGGPGIMEAANRGAHDVGAKSIGLNITLPHEQHSNPYISPDLNFLFHYFSIRKMHFLLRARALCCFPGGFGTLDELFEALTLIQTGKTGSIPVLIFGREYWDSLINWQTFVEWGTISEKDLDLFHFVDTVEEAVDIIANSTVQTNI